MRVNKEFSHDRYPSHHRQGYDDRLKTRTHRHDDRHRSQSTGKSSSRISSKSHYYHSEKHSSTSSNRKDHDRSNYYNNQTLSSSSPPRHNRPKNNEDSYSPLIANKNILFDSLHSDVLFNKASQSMPNRRSTSCYTESELDYYSSVPKSSSSYRRDNVPSSSPYKDEYLSQNHTGNDLYIRNDYRTITSPSVATTPSVRNTIDSYKDLYRQSDYNNRSQQLDIESNRVSSSRAYHSMTSAESSTYRPDSYRTLSTSRVSSPSSHPSLASSCSSSISPYAVTRDQCTQTLSPIRENDYQIRDYRTTTSIDHRYTIPNKSSDHYENDYYLSSSSRDRSNLKRSRSSLDENDFKRPIRR